LGDINTSSFNKTMVRINCTETGKAIDAELIQTTKTKIVVILPGFIKMNLYKDPKPNFYTTRQGGLEFTCITKK